MRGLLWRRPPSAGVLELAAINAALETGVASPLDDAILNAHTPVPGSLRTVAEIPFEFLRKRVTVVVEDAAAGAPRVIPLNDAAFAAVRRMVARADKLGHSEPSHYLWCASQHNKPDPTKPASKWDTAWRASRDEAGLPGLRVHDLRHTVVTRLLEAGEPDLSLNRLPVISHGECSSTIRTSA